MGAGANLVPLGWIGIIRLGLVQTALGAIVVLTTSTLNRVMVVELALPATLPGLLVAIHYAVQVMRPRMGYGSDIGGRLTGWIVGGMAVLALGGLGAAVATAWMTTNTGAGIALAVVSFLAIGLGVGAAGTSLLVLLAKRVDAHRRAAAATIVWLMMIAGFAVTATVAGHLLDPFSPARLIAVTAGVSGCAWLLSVAAVAGLEGRGLASRSRGVLAGAESEDRATAHSHEAAGAMSVTATSSITKPTFRAALAQVWGEPEARRFAIFIFVSMLAYSAQDLILEPFAGAVFGATPGESTKLSGVQHAGVFVGMLLVALTATAFGGRRFGSNGVRLRAARSGTRPRGGPAGSNGVRLRAARSGTRPRGGPAGSLRRWTIGGCIASALALGSLAVAGFVGPAFPLQQAVFALGVANGVYAVAAIGSMMGMASSGRAAREGTRMGLWGAAQAVAFGMGGLAGTLASDLARYLLGSPLAAYSAVFATEALLFLAASVLAVRVGRRGATAATVANATSANTATARSPAAETQTSYAPEMSLR